MRRIESWGLAGEKANFQGYSKLFQQSNPNNGALRHINNADGYYLDQSGTATITANQLDRPDHIEDVSNPNGTINYGLEPCITEGADDRLATDEYHNTCQVTVRPESGGTLRWFCLPDDQALADGRRNPTDREYNLIRRATNNFTFRVQQGDSSATLPHNVCHLGRSVHIYENHEVLRLACPESGQGSTFFGGAKNFSSLPPNQLVQFARHISSDSRGNVMCVSRGERNNGYLRGMFFATQNSADSLTPLVEWFERTGGFSARGARSFTIPYFNGAQLFDGFVDDPTAAAYYDGLYAFLSPQYSTRNSSINMGVSIGASAFIGLLIGGWQIRKSLDAQKKGAAEVFDLEEVINHRDPEFREIYSANPETQEQAFARTESQARYRMLFQRAINDARYPHVYLSAASGGGKGWLINTIGHLVTNHLLEADVLDGADVEVWSIDANAVTTVAGQWANGPKTVFGRLLNRARDVIRNHALLRRFLPFHFLDGVRVTYRNIRHGQGANTRKVIFFHLEEGHQFLRIANGSSHENILSALLTVMNRSIPEDAQIIFIIDSSQMRRVFSDPATRDFPRRGLVIELAPPTVDQIRQSVREYYAANQRSRNRTIQRQYQTLDFTPEALEAIALLGHDYGRQQPITNSAYRDPAQSDEENIGAPPSSNNKLMDAIASDATSRPEGRRYSRSVLGSIERMRDRVRSRRIRITAEHVFRTLAQDALNRGERGVNTQTFHNQFEAFRNNPNALQDAIIDAYYRGFNPIRGRVDPRNLPSLDNLSVFDSPLRGLSNEMEAAVRAMESYRNTHRSSTFNISNEAIEVAVELSQGDAQKALQMFQECADAIRNSQTAGTTVEVIGSDLRTRYGHLNVNPQVAPPGSSTTPSPTNASSGSTDPTTSLQWRHALEQPFGETEINALAISLQQLGTPGQEAAHAFAGAIHSYRQSHRGAPMTFETVVGLFPRAAREAARAVANAGVDTSNCTERAVYELAIAVAKTNGVNHAFTDDDRSDFLDAYRAHTRPATPASVPSGELPWREVWSTSLGDNEAIIRALETVDPELHRLWTTEIAPSGETFSTLGELIVRLETINPEFVERAHRALTNGSSTQALTDNPHRAIYALLDQTREGLEEAAVRGSGRPRPTPRHMGTYEERESNFRVSLGVERVELRAGRMSADVERERRESFERRNDPTRNARTVRGRP